MCPLGGVLTDGGCTWSLRTVGAIAGTITAFSGTFDSSGHPVDGRKGISIPDWHICDGTTGTPDLRGRFILGSSAEYADGSSGGEKTHTLTIDEMPSHNHTYRFDANSNPEWGIGLRKDESEMDRSTYTNGISGRAHTMLINNTGGGQAHNNMPPYYALSYIMKLL